MLSLALMCILSIGVLVASARFFGKTTTSTSDWADGDCSYRTTCWVYYVLWIPVNEDCKTDLIGCITNA